METVNQQFPAFSPQPLTASGSAPPIASTAQNLPAVNQADVEPSWLMGASKLLSSLPETSPHYDALMLGSLGEPDEKFVNCLKQPLEIIGVTKAWAEGIDEKTGEDISGWRWCVLLTDGRTIGGRAWMVGRVLDFICGRLGPGPWRNPVKMTLTQPKGPGTSIVVREVSYAQDSDDKNAKKR